MNQKGLMSILIVIFVAAAALGGYFIYQKQSTPPPQPSPSSNPTANPDSIGANWKTYTDEQLGFSLKYPLNWKVDINCNGQDAVYTGPSAGSIKYIDSPCFTTPDFEQDSSGLGEGGLISGGVVVIAQDRKHIVKTALEQFCAPTEDYLKLSDCQKIKMGEKEIVRRSGTQFALYTLAGIIDSNQIISGFSAYYDQKSEEETIQTLDQILSTFKFTQ